MANNVDLSQKGIPQFILQSQKQANDVLNYGMVAGVHLSFMMVGLESHVPVVSSLWQQIE